MWCLSFGATAAIPAKSVKDDERSGLGQAAYTGTVIAGGIQDLTRRARKHVRDRSSD
jgi:hypothetical protein